MILAIGLCQIDGIDDEENPNGNMIILRDGRIEG